MIEKDEYLEAKVMTAKPHQLHLMVVDASIQHALRAKEGIENENLEVSHLALCDSRACIAELIGGLREEEAPEIVGNMKDLLLFVFKKLTDADTNLDSQALDDAITILRQHQETWIELIESLPKEEPAENFQNESEPVPGMSWET